ncbi:SnoaL-like domain-containing protein [Kocuria sp. JC486]|uniref:nuclear transport factor 2 family protein n=1 Tax=Kocuria sp. JC486 TaxID=1970736 RepID=UPI001422DD46|nr:SnoaL-like domain-containing protein [Kocuria sp. JC486]
MAQCHAVLVDFLAAIDSGHATQALALFRPDASIDARGKRLHGHDQIAAFLAKRESEDRCTVHLIANEVLRRHASNEVELTALLFLHERSPDGQYRLKQVLDTTQVFTRTDNDWRISQRSTTPLHPSTSAGG